MSSDLLKEAQETLKYWNETYINSGTGLSLEEFLSYILTRKESALHSERLSHEETKKQLMALEDAVAYRGCNKSMMDKADSVIVQAIQNSQARKQG